MRNAPNQQPHLRVVVVENGAESSLPRSWPGDGASELMVLVGWAGMSHKEFALATLLRLGQLRRSGRRIRQVMVAMGPESGGQALASRCLLARFLISHQLLDGNGELVFATESELDSEGQQDLMRMAGMLTAELGASGMNISLRMSWCDNPQPAGSPGADDRAPSFASRSPTTSALQPNTTD